jgi:hypothetical protein
MPRTTLTASHRQNAWQLRQHGFTYDQIAARVGYANGGAARHAVLAHQATLDGTTYTRGRALAPAADWAIPTWFSFGVELECAGITMATAVAAVTSVTGRPVLEGGYHNATIHGWSDWGVERDGSIAPWGVEVVSPVLRGEAGLAEVAAVADALRAAGATVNTSTGMHVHVGIDQLTAEQVCTFIDWYTMGQGAINRLVAPGRVGRRTYTGPLAEREVESMKARARGQYGGNERYRHLNGAHIGTRKVIEVRQHHGTVRGSQVRTWVRLLAAAIVAARNDSLVARRTSSVTTLTSSLVLPAATRTALAARAARRPDAHAA